MIDPARTLAAVDRWRASRRAIPLAHYRPTAAAFQLAAYMSDPAVSEVLVEGANRVSKTYMMAMITGGLAVGADAPWMPRRRQRWTGRLKMALVAVSQDSARGDALSLVRDALPVDVREAVTLSRVGVIQLPHLEIHTIGWLHSIEKARLRLQGLKAHIVWVNEECPPELFEEAAARGGGAQGVRVITATLGLEVAGAHAARLDPDFLIDRAHQGPTCGHPRCVHTPIEGSGHRHIWLPFTAETTPWLTDEERRRHIESLPIASRQIRLGLDRGRIVTGRCWAGYDPDIHRHGFGLADIAEAAGDAGGAQLWIVGDCGATDATAAGMLAVCRHRCEVCVGLGEVACRSCSGRRGGCPDCSGRGRRGCMECEGAGEAPEAWVLGDYQSAQASSTDDNARGLRELATECGIVDVVGRPDFGPSRWDAFILDNIRPKQYTEHRTEGDALRARLGAGMPSPSPAYKLRSARWSYERASVMFRRNRLHIHPRAKRTHEMMMAWAWGKDGADPQHDGPQGYSHTDAWLRYAINEMHIRGARVTRGR